VQNLGTINAIGGDVIMIGKTVDNEGTINAPKGHAGWPRPTMFSLRNRAWSMFLSAREQSEQRGR